MFELGKKVKDKVSGYTGIATAEHRFLNGCIRISVQAPATKDGTMPDEKWFDIDQVEIVGDGVTVKAKKTGGPQTQNPPSF